MKLWASGTESELEDNKEKKTKLNNTSEMMKPIYDGDLLRVKLDEIDDLIYPLLQWLITSNLSHIRILREEEQFTQ